MVESAILPFYQFENSSHLIEVSMMDTGDGLKNLFVLFWLLDCVQNSGREWTLTQLIELFL